MRERQDPISRRTFTSRMHPIMFGQDSDSTQARWEMSVSSVRFSMKDGSMMKKDSHGIPKSTGLLSVSVSTPRPRTTPCRPSVRSAKGTRPSTGPHGSTPSTHTTWPSRRPGTSPDTPTRWSIRNTLRNRPHEVDPGITPGETFSHVFT